MTTQLQELLAKHPAVAELGPKWLAKHVGAVSERTWTYWLKGRDGKAQDLPLDVVQALTLAAQFTDSLRRIDRPGHASGPKSRH